MHQKSIRSKTTAFRRYHVVNDATDLISDLYCSEASCLLSLRLAKDLWNCQVFLFLLLEYFTHLLFKRTDFNTDECIGEFIKREWTYGLFWAGGAAEKKKGSGPIMSNFLGWVFQLFVAKKKKKKNWKHCSVRTEKLHWKKVKKNKFFLGKFLFFSLFL